MKSEQIQSESSNESVSEIEYSNERASRWPREKTADLPQSGEAKPGEVSADEMAQLAKAYAPDYVYLEELERQSRKKPRRRFFKHREPAAKQPLRNRVLRSDDTWQSEPAKRTFAARLAVRLAPIYGAFYDWQMTRGQGVREIRQRLTLSHFPNDAAPLKIAFISDLHYGPTSGRTAARQAWKIARDSRPDVLILGGDFLYADEGGLPALLRELQRWKRDAPPGGMYACLGNHDYEAGVDTLIMALEACGVRVLINENVELPSPWKGVYVAGLDDHFHGDAQPQQTLENIPERACAILVAHSPDVCQHGEMRRCDLTLCGHTHGGQICLPNGEAPHLPSEWAQQYPWGLHRHSGNWLFVSRGVGTVFFPLRMFAPPDVAIFELARNWNGKSTVAR